jgi:ankyrin repeat protein
LLAAQHGFTEIVNILVAGGADVNAFSGGWTALMMAAQQNQLEVAKALAAATGINIDARNPQNYTAMMLAAGHGHLEIMNLLLDHGADVNARNYADGTALGMAAQSGHLHVVRALLARGADPAAKNRAGATAETAAALASHPEIAELLKKAVAAGSGAAPAKAR